MEGKGDDKSKGSESIVNTIQYNTVSTIQQDDKGSESSKVQSQYK